MLDISRVKVREYHPMPQSRSAAVAACTKCKQTNIVRCGFPPSFDASFPLHGHGALANPCARLLVYPLAVTDADRRRAALLLAVYAAWLRGTWRAKLSLRSWGPRWLARWLALPLPWLGAALGVSAEARLDGVTADDLETIGPCIVTLSPHGLGFGHTLLTGPALMEPPLASLQPLGVAAWRRDCRCHLDRSAVLGGMARRMGDCCAGDVWKETSQERPGEGASLSLTCAGTIWSGWEGLWARRGEARQGVEV